MKNIPFKSCKSLLITILISYINIEKNGKKLYLLKQKAKTISAKKKRKVVPLLGSIQDYLKAEKNVTVIPQNGESQASVE